MVMLHKGFPGGLDGKETACHAGDLGSILGLGKPLGKGMAAYSSFGPGEFHKHRSLESYSPWGSKESDTTEQVTHTGTQGYINTRGQKGGEERKSRK